LANASAALTTVGVTPGATNIFRVAVLELRSTTGGGGSPAPMPRGYILF
jgi:hypothetical protein